MYYVYLLASIADETEYYLGYTSDLKRRLEEHNNDFGCKTTKNKQWDILYYEAYPSKEFALKREKQLKKNRGSKRALYNRLNIR